MDVVLRRVDPRPEFRARLDRARTAASSLEHSFSKEWAAGRLNAKQMGFWAIQHHYYIERVAQNFAEMYARCPDVDTRLYILDNLVGEEMVTGRHPDLLKDFAVACGYGSDDIERVDLDGHVLPATRAMRAWTVELVTTRHIVEQAAGIMVALEGQLPGMYASYVRSCRAIGFRDDDLKFFTVHIEGDEQHADVGYQLCERYATTPELEDLAVGACLASAQMRLAYLESVTNAISELG